MFSKRLAFAALAASVAFTPAARVSADAGDFIAGAIIGGIVGSVATNQNQKNKAAQKQRTYRPSLPSTQEGRNIQASLNYFGFNAGRVDGQLGRQSRSAISQYQAYMGYPATGELNPFEYDLLTSSYNRAQAGGYSTNQIIATNSDGTRGLLKAYRAELAGQPLQQAPQAQLPVQTVVVAPQPQTVVVAPQPVVQAPEVAAPAPTTVVTPAPGTTTTLAAVGAQAGSDAGLPNFFNSAEAQASLASHCNTVSLLTSTNGYTTVSSMTDPTQALNEQFCLARTYAISRSEDLISKVSGFTPQQVAAQCEGFAPVLKDHVSALSLKPRDQVVEEVSGFILGTGMSPAQLSGTAKICLGVGYRTDNMDVALGSALMLFALGEGVYGELMGHHLAMGGFGTAKRTDVAATWYEAGLAASDNGADAAFVPGQPERKEIIRKASLQINGGAPAQAATLPVFSVTE